MNKNIFGSKLISGGEGIDSLTIKNKLDVVGSVSLPANSIQIEDIADLQNTLNTTTQRITDIQYGDGYTNLPNLYISNNLLIYDSSKGSNLDVVPTIDDLSIKTTTKVEQHYLPTIKTCTSRFAKTMEAIY